MNKFLSILLSTTLLVSPAMAREDEDHVVQRAGPLQSASPLQEASPLQDSSPLEAAGPLQNAGPLAVALPLQETGPIAGQMSLNVSAPQPSVTMPTAPVPQLAPLGVLGVPSQLQSFLENPTAAAPEAIATLASSAPQPQPPMARASYSSPPTVATPSLTPLAPVVYNPMTSSNLSPN